LYQKHFGLSKTRSATTRGGARGVPEGALFPKNFAWLPSGPPKIFRMTSGGVGLFLKVLHRPLTAPLVAKLAPPNKNVWLRPWQQLIIFLLFERQQWMSVIA